MTRRNEAVLKYLNEKKERLILIENILLLQTKKSKVLDSKKRKSSYQQKNTWLFDTVTILSQDIYFSMEQQYNFSFFMVGLFLLKKRSYFLQDLGAYQITILALKCTHPAFQLLHDSRFGRNCNKLLDCLTKNVNVNTLLYISQVTHKIKVLT